MRRYKTGKRAEGSFDAVENLERTFFDQRTEEHHAWEKILTPKTVHERW